MSVLYIIVYLTYLIACDSFGMLLEYLQTKYNWWVTDIFLANSYTLLHWKLRFKKIKFTFLESCVFRSPA